MDPSSFANQWNQLSYLNQQQILPANISGDHDFQLLNPTESAENISINPCIMKPMLTSFSTCSPIEASPKITYSQERPKKIPKMISWSSCVEQLPINLVPKEEISIGFHSIQDQGLKSSSSQGLRPAHAHEHIIAERKRREKLSQRFIALAAVIPGLKKADKASILGDAVKYVTELEQTLKSLQDQKTKKIVESVAINKDHTLSTNNNDSSTGGSSLVICSRSDEKPNQNPSGDLSPEIQIRFLTYNLPLVFPPIGPSCDSRTSLAVLRLIVTVASFSSLPACPHLLQCLS
ncbi:uncharacterized protein A4U43_C07F31400 [Asparagus officinalis]|uniref:BHLH domain-containing protein n=1 Tax=Asparagus officinalis TaxID=4686 RepID=A0A5P1EGC5_ASPOF|nr:uncharacterized protein A4U43_C07F31400 [Asparagus officinalis]